MATNLSENYNKVLENISIAASRSGRPAEAVRLVVVTKGQSVNKIREVIAAGASDLGENYPEETIQKINEMGSLASSVRWHMIGHLQSRKIKYVIQAFACMHSIDRTSIASELNARLDRPMDVLLEVNLSGEESKGGFLLAEPKSWPGFSKIVSDLSKLEKLRIIGLTTMPPYAQEPETSRPIFRKCKELCDFVAKETGLTTMKEISMGTSLDYLVAIEEGATFVRVGEAIMGPRDYSKKI